MRAGVPDEGLPRGGRARVWVRLHSEGRRRRPLAAPAWGIAALIVLASAAVVAGVTARRLWSAPRPAAEPARPREEPSRARRPQRPVETVAAPTIAVAEAPPTPPAFAAEAAFAPPGLVAPSPRPTRPSRVDEPRTREPAEAAPPPAPAPVEPLAAPAPPAPAAPAPTAPAPATRDTAPTPTADPPAARPPTPAAPSALAVETAMLGEALARLRQEHDAKGVLAALDGYDARFPNGTLHHEAEIARVDALLLLGRDADALAVLRPLALQPRGRDLELRVIRGELAAGATCQAAVDDFDRVLAAAAPRALAERALHGRAACRARLGDGAAARRDLEEYLRRFPDGRFAAEARRSLAGEDL